MPAPLTDDWLREQLELCEKATVGPWHVGERGGPAGPFHSLVTPTGQVVAGMIDATSDAQGIAAAHEGYPLVLRQYTRLRQALDACIPALTRILEKHGGDWVQRDVIFGSEEFKLGMEALKKACGALGYVLDIQQRTAEIPDA